MKADTQHLEYLISQYVDGTLDTPSRKSVEQQLLHNPGARKLYKEQHDVQDLLDDWGSRIPMVNWEEFDRKLAKRLDGVTVGGQRRPRAWLRWARPLSIAAGLLIAAGIGYWWHGTSAPGITPSRSAQTTADQAPYASVDFPDRPLMTPYVRSVSFPEARVPESKPGQSVVVTLPDDTAAVQSLRETVWRGLPGLAQLAQPAKDSAVAAGVVAVKNTEKETVIP